MLSKRRRRSMRHVRTFVFERFPRDEHRGDAAQLQPSASRGKLRGVASPHAHPICVGDAGDVETSQLNQVAHPRPIEAAQNRAPGAFVIDENKLRRLESGDKDVIRRQVAVDVAGAMQPRDLRAERTQHNAPRRKRRALQMTHKIKSIDPRGHYYLAAAAALGAEQKNFGNSDPVGPQMLRDRRDVNRTPALEYRTGSMQTADRVEHFEICIETMIEMIEPGLGVTRAPYASLQGAVDRRER